MRRIESIRVRCAYAHHDEAKLAIQRFLQASTGDTPYAIRLFVNSEGPTELLVLIETHGAATPPVMDAVGVHLARALRNLGLVSHVIWTEVDVRNPEDGEET